MVRMVESSNGEKSPEWCTKSSTVIVNFALYTLVMTVPVKVFAAIGRYRNAADTCAHWPIGTEFTWVSTWTPWSERIFRHLFGRSSTMSNDRRAGLPLWED